MVNLGTHHEDIPPVTNHPHQHAFVLCGDRTIFGVHMTQYHCEIHKYQLVLEFEFADPAVLQTLRDFRRSNPGATFFLCNAPASAETDVQLLSIPEIASGRVESFTANIFFGFRPPPQPEPDDWFPWDLSWVIPMIGDFQVRVRRIVAFRPFAHHERSPQHPGYLLWGRGDEAHLTSLQTGTLLTGPFDPPLFGIDCDHVMSLASAPSWLEPAMLEAGIVVSLPKIDRYGPDGEYSITLEPPFAEGEWMTVLYRGITPGRPVTAGPTFLWCALVSNSPTLAAKHAGDWPFVMSSMPKEYWKVRAG